MRKIAVVNMKGGVGKTTTAVHLAARLAGAHDQRVLLIDVDPQGNVGHALNVHADATVRELLLGEAALDTAIARNVRPNLDVMPATPTAFTLETQLAGVMRRETLLARRLRELEGYDAVVIDSSPSMNLLTYNALLYATELIVPIGMDRMAIVGARQTVDGVHEIRDLWPSHSLDLLAVLPTTVNMTTNASRAIFAALEDDDEMWARLFRPGIRQCLDLTYANASQQTIWEYAPRSRAAEDYASFVDFVGGNGDCCKGEDATDQKVH
ncbi:MAG: ParA family protein [Vicinamibacterales bacterium]|jgi:chromosome partitioning protein|nr:ParA family protein [Vicinamibacterales bacterium]